MIALSGIPFPQKQTSHTAAPNGFRRESDGDMPEPSHSHAPRPAAYSDGSRV